MRRNYRMDMRLRKWLSMPHLIILAGLFIVLRITWLSIHNILHAPDHFDIDGQPSGHELDNFFKPKECIIGKNNSCIPVQPDDVYLGRGLYAHGSQFYLNGRPFRILSGSFHYFRTQPAQWGDRLMKMKAAGLNTVMTYVPWNLHEPIKGHYVFSGDWDLASFIKQAQKVGLKVIIRPGPYICAEWELGGLPAWLLKDPAMKLRTSYKPYLRHVEEYFTKLLYILAPLSYKKGGPIIAFQVENEYGAYGTDKEYLWFLTDQFKKWGIEELLFTSDGAKFHDLKHGSLSGLLATVNFKNNQKENLMLLKQFQPDKPLMVTEFWPGWFDHWEEHHHIMTNDVFQKSVANILINGASMNFYIFVGGTNFGFWNGANNDYEGRKYAPTVTSYDYDAPISEDGKLTEKFFTSWRILSQFANDVEELPDMALLMNTTSKAYGTLRIEKWLPYKSLTDIAQDMNIARYGNRLSLNKTVNMEQLDLSNDCGQSVGWLLYRTEIELMDTAQNINVDGVIHDRAQFIVEHQEVGVWYRNTNATKVTLPPAEHKKRSSLLDILVENMGRINYKKLDDQQKGILGNVYVGGTMPKRWLHIPLDFDEEFISTVSQHESWQIYTRGFSKLQPESVMAPALFKLSLNLDKPPEDTFVDMKGWNKGIVIVNGFIIGRYWHVGPQRTLYLPGPLLMQGINTIIIFELHKPGDTLTFIDKHLLDSRW